MNQTWTRDPAFVAVLEELARAVAGQPDACTGEPLASSGVGSNCAATFENPVFALRDYCWCEGSVHAETVPEDDSSCEALWQQAIESSGGTSTGCPVNFEHFSSGLQAVWYKHLGRDTSFSRAVSPEEIQLIRAHCLRSIGAVPGSGQPEHDLAELDTFTARSAQRWAEALALLAQ